MRTFLAVPSLVTCRHIIVGGSKGNSKEKHSLRIFFEFFNRREKRKEVEQKVEDKEAAEKGDYVRIIEGVGAQVLLNQIRQCAASDALAMDVAMAAAAPIQWLTVAPHHTKAAVATAV